MNILITGGAGFIGSNLAEHHLIRGDEVFVVDDLTTGRLENLKGLIDHPRFRFQKADLLEWPQLEEAVRWADRVYHLAAVLGMFRVLAQPEEVIRVNVIGFERVLEAIVRTCSRAALFLSSSSCVYGHASICDMSEQAELTILPGTGGLTGYSVSKLANEIQALSYSRKFGIPVYIARLFNTVGRRQSGVYGFVLPRFVQQALEGSPLTVFGDGSQTRSFCDVRDTIGMLNALADSPAALGQVVNVGNPREIAILALAQLVKLRAESDSPISFVPFSVGYGEEVQQITQRRPCLERMTQLTGYHHRWTLEDTIDDLIAYYRPLLAPARFSVSRPPLQLTKKYA
jgi:UDP-glucose 4-epimerase